MNATESSERYSVSWWWTSPINESKSIQCSKTDQPITDKRRNPTTRIVSDLQRKLQDLNKSGNFSEEEYKKLQVSGPNSASFYGLPKFHNVESQPDNDHFIIPAEELNCVSLRPRNSCIAEPTFQVSKYVAKILRTLQVDDQYTVRNSTEFAEFVLSQRVTDDEELVSFDVVLLFTSIPVKLTIDVVKPMLWWIERNTCLQWVAGSYRLSGIITGK